MASSAELGLCAAELGVPCFFGAGDTAFTLEAEALSPDIVTCPVKRGVTRGHGDNCALNEYRDRNTAAIYIPPPRARDMIRSAAQAATNKLKRNPPPLIPIKPPFERVVILRPTEAGQPKQIAKDSHATSVIEPDADADAVPADVGGEVRKSNIPRPPIGGHPLREGGI